MDNGTLSPEIQENKGSPPESRTDERSYECNSYSYSVSVSNDYFGFNIFELYPKEQLAKLCNDPIANNEILREISTTLYGTSGIYTNTVDYLTSMATLDKVIVPHGKSKSKKARNKELALEVCRSIKDTEFVRDALFKGMIDGIAFYYFETISRPLSQKRTMSDYEVQTIIELNDSDLNISIITLPTDYCRIIGIKNSFYVVAFNMDYFRYPEGGTIENKLRKYPKEIRDAYREYDKGATGNWVVLDNTKTIVHKIKSKREEIWGRPIVLAAIKDILYSDYFVDTKRNVLDGVNNEAYIETFPEGEKRGLSSLTSRQQKEQHDTVKSAILNKNKRGQATFVSVAAGTKITRLESSNTDILDEKYEKTLSQKISGDLGIASSLLDGVGSGSYATQQSNLELLCAQIYMWIEQIENELNKCINANVIKDKKNWVEVSYLRIANVNKKETIQNCKELYLQGKGSLTLWAAACGIRPDVFYALLDEELENDIENKYPVHKTSYTMSNKDTSNSAGRPESESTNPETIASKSAGKNNIPTPSDK